MKKIFEFIVLTLLTFVVSCTKVGAPSDNNDSAQIESFKLNTASPLELPLGDEYLISYSIRPRELQHSKKVNWTSSKSSVVSVSEGVVKGLKEGQARITAEVDGFKASIEVNVILLKVQDFTLPGKVDIFQNHTTSVAVTDIVPARISTSRFTWKIIQNNDDPVLSYVVEQDRGCVQLTGLKTGPATLQVTADNITKTCQILVKKRSCESLAINTSISTLIIGEEIELEAIAKPEGLFNPQEFKWTSSAPEILKLSSDTGNKVKVKALSAGIATVSVSINVPGINNIAKVELGAFDPNYKISVWAPPYLKEEETDVTNKNIVIVPDPQRYGNSILICDQSGIPLSTEIQQQCTLTFPDNDNNLSAAFKDGSWGIQAKKYCKNRKYKVVVAAPNGSQATFTVSPNPRVSASITLRGSSVYTNELNTDGVLKIPDSIVGDTRVIDGDYIQFYYYLGGGCSRLIHGLTANSNFTRKGVDKFGYDAYFVTGIQPGENTMTIQLGDLNLTLQVIGK